MQNYVPVNHARGSRCRQVKRGVIFLKIIIMTEVKKPIGIKLLGWLYIIGAVIAIFGIFTLKGRLLTYESKHFKLPFSYYYVVQSFTVMNIVAGLTLGIGLLKTKPWARVYVIIWAIICWLYTVVFFFIYTNRYTIPYLKSIERSVIIHYALLVISISWVALVYYYLNRPKVKKQFEE